MVEANAGRLKQFGSVVGSLARRLSAGWNRPFDVAPRFARGGSSRASFVTERRDPMKELVSCLAFVVLAVTSAIAQSVPGSVEQKIREIYAQKYPDNFSMQKTLIQDQLESYRYVQRWTSESGVPQDVFNKVKETYDQKYPDNYSMQKTLVQDQCESYRFMQSYTFVPGVPNTVLANLKQKYAQKYPYNFSMQKTLVQDQVKSYLELQR
jgi:hypothetical protein